MDDDLKRFIESEMAIIVGTRDADLIPEVCFGWGPRVLPGGREMEVFVNRAAGLRTVANLRNNRLFAATFASPITYRAVQLKGWCIEIDEPSPEDEAWLERHRTAFTEAVRARGEPAHVSRTYWSRDVVRLRVAVNELYDQTPGPGAGRKL